MALYTLSRLVFVWVNHDLYPDISAAHLWEMLRGGWRFDLTALLYLNSLYLILMLLPLPPFIRNKKAYQTTATWFYWVPNIIGLLVNCVDMVYFRFTDRRTTCTFFSKFQNEGNLLSIFCQSMVQYWYVTLFALIACALLVLLTRKKSVSSYRWSAVSYYICELALMLATIYFVVIGIRGGFGKYTRPITISNALQYTNSPRETAIVLNTPFSLMKSLENETYIHPHYMSDAEMEQIFSPVHTPSALGIQHSNDNVVVLILESFGKEYIDAGYTPFLDSLFQHSKTYRYSYASGRKSIDAMPSVLAFLGYGKPFFAFGEDALTQMKQHPYAVCYNHPMYQIMSADTLILYDGQCPATNDMERYLQAYIQQYISRMISNRLTVNDGRESR